MPKDEHPWKGTAEHGDEFVRRVIVIRPRRRARRVKYFKPREGRASGRREGAAYKPSAAGNRSEKATWQFRRSMVILSGAIPPSSKCENKNLDRADSLPLSSPSLQN